MRIDPALAIIDKEGTLRRVAQAMTNNLTVDDNLSTSKVVVTFPGTPDTDLVVHHTLSRTPTSFLWHMDQAGTVYAPASSKAQWTNKQIVLRCSAASAVATLEIV